MTPAHKKVPSIVLSLAASVAILTGSFCGPELTTPGSGDLSGTWHAPGPAAGLSDITMVLGQTSDGGITGTFTATGTPGIQPCPQSGPCLISSTIKGANTVLQVNIDLDDSGTFTGQLITSVLLRGTMTHGASALVEFDRVP